MNHAIFKALLFLGAGSVVTVTGTRDMEKYGGLIRFMPFTAFFFLIGSLAISAFPPFNGFASEWLTFQTLFVGIGSASVLIKTVFIFATGSLVFTGGLAAALFREGVRNDLFSPVHGVRSRVVFMKAVFLHLLALGVLALSDARVGNFPP